MNRIVDVAVLGAGIAGSAAAIRLARLGRDTLLVDESLFPRHKVCGEFLSPEARGMLVSLGIVLTSEEHALKPSTMGGARIVLPGGSSLRLPLPGTAFGISRFALDAELHRMAAEAGATVATGTVVTTVTATDNAYTVSLVSDGEEETVKARAVLAAWGRRARNGLPGGAAITRSSSFRVGVKAHYEGITQDGEASVELFVFSGGYVGVAPIESGRMNVSALMTREAFRAAGGSVDAVFGYIARIHPQFGARLSGGAIVPGTIAATAPVYTNRRLAGWEEIPLLGDAAVMIPPLCGDGMAMALRSAELCARFTDRYLDGSLTLPQFRRMYTASLRREFTWPIRIGRLCEAMLKGALSARLLLGLGRLAPALTAAAVRGTRLRQ